MFLDSNPQMPSIRWDSRPESNEPKTKVVLFTQSRSGSSFIGKVLQQRPDTFYSFEPLRFISFNEESNFITHDERLGSNVSEIISNILQCNLHHIEGASVRYYPDKDEARQIWLPIAFPVHHSFNEAISQCAMRMNVAIKIIRVNYLKYLIPALTNDKVAVIQLIRDPRGRLSSWVKLKLTDNGKKSEVSREDLENPLLEGTLRNDSKEHCQLLEENYKYIHYAMDNNLINHEHFITIRYEDFSYKPKEMVEKLFHYLGEEPTAKFLKWLDVITHTDDHKAYIPVRDSAKTAEAWRQFLPFNLVKVIQEECGFVLSHYGYKPVESEESYQNFNTSLVDTLPVDIPQL